MLPGAVQHRACPCDQHIPDGKEEGAAQVLNGCGTRRLPGQSTPLPGTSSLLSTNPSQVELHTERGPVILVDPRGAAALTLAAGAYHSVQIAHDIKEVGPHSLICSAVGLGEHNSRVAHSQSFRFPVTNPITVRSKVSFGGERAGVCMGVVYCVPVSQKGYVRHQTLQVYDYIIHNLFLLGSNEWWRTRCSWKWCWRAQ